jgi:hypothetical protein
LIDYAFTFFWILITSLFNALILAIKLLIKVVIACIDAESETVAVAASVTAVAGAFVPAPVLPANTIGPEDNGA